MDENFTVTQLEDDLASLRAVAGLSHASVGEPLDRVIGFVEAVLDRVLVVNDEIVVSSEETSQT